MPRGKLWQAHEDAALRELLKDEVPGDDMSGWDLIAQQLPVDVAVRTGRAAQTRAVALELREAPRRKAKNSSGWEAARQPGYRPESRGLRQTDCAGEQTARKRPAPSPVIVGPSPPPATREKRPAAAVAANAIAADAASESPSKKPKVLHDSAKRVAIAMQFVYGHKQCDAKFWFGKDGVIAKILEEITWLPTGHGALCLPC
jgi:hypothetical protein